MILRALYYYFSLAVVGLFGVGVLLLTGLVMGYMLGRWALLPMVGLVVLLGGVALLRDTLAAEPDA